MPNEESKILNELKGELSKSTISVLKSQSCISSIKHIVLNSNTFEIAVNSAYTADSLKRNLKAISEILNKITSKNLPISIVLEKKDQKTQNQPVQNQQSIAKEVKVKEKIESFKATTQQSNVPRLNPNFTLENFIPGDNSNFAYNIARAVAANPAGEYNPFLIFSPVGLGKTHLAEAIGNKIIETLGYKVMYVTCEYFINEFVKSLGEKSAEQYKNMYRNVDVLIIDDVQFLDGKLGIQDALFNIFNSLKDANKQMIFTSDKPMSAMKEFQPRLSTRLNSGIAADLQPPPFEIRLAILKEKCIEKGYDVKDEILIYIAENITSNVRDLEGCLTRLVGFTRLIDAELTLEKASEILKDLILNSKDTSGITIENIIKYVSEGFNVTTMDIRGDNKNKKLVIPRQVAMYLARTLTKYSSTEIASYFGGKNHTTILYGSNKIAQEMGKNEDLKNKVEALKNTIIAESK